MERSDILINKILQYTVWYELTYSMDTTTINTNNNN